VADGAKYRYPGPQEFEDTPTDSRLTRRSRNQTGPNFESWSPLQTQSKGAWILIVTHIPKNILPEA